MQATYYQYYFTKGNGQKKYSADLRNFLQKYCSWKIPVFKSQFEHAGERLYLVHTVGDQYLFLHTLDKEIIKKIDSKNLTLADLKSHLAGDSAGFASYVNFRGDFFGIACKVLSPRGATFASYINQVIEALNLPYKFHAVALTHQMQRKDISKLSRVGKITVELQRDNKLHEDLVEFISGQTGQNYAEVGPVEITIRPEKRLGNIKAILQGVSSQIGQKGVSDFEARAVTALADKVIDVYLVGEGAVRHSISGDTDAKIQADFDKQMSRNALLQEKLKEMRSNVNVQKTTFADLDSPAKPRN
ncbi:Protein rexA [Xanthomonas translucens]|uniref:Uncharacterized protein n=1 Tax=Xanthomonas translucens pv. translucens DSM 18974 TaxID=1261556 RepID=A0A1C3TI15_XANCT|nr:Protein rexA [Xanthomonas translucens]MCC8445462.1 hypothetical protein [Xanthomonas translucens pv. translucens]MCS3360380.1 hypothetical protein [Xanthomonas translucens pv. translucens]MCS3374196.1 hypothetical protein [Xanthomonas translucens pv. translucens]MCT8276113.1 hypothetical protein [Xanthomonas translucens pv. translucens]MCT8279887.1 hypothetical protein [Xanthomonas translucens pv. translucens]